MRQIGALRDQWADSQMSARITANFTRLIRELRATNEKGWRYEDLARQCGVPPMHEVVVEGTLIDAPAGYAVIVGNAMMNNDQRNRLKREIDAEFDVDAADDKIHG
jgi:hypothetical protein